MRRIYESDALRRDDGHFSPRSDANDDYEPQAARSLPSATLGRYLLPGWVHRRAISLSITTPREEYPVGTSIPFVITMKNTMPFPVTIPTNSPLLWTWYVDDHAEAATFPHRDPPDEPGQFVFGRGERKRFRRHWDQLFRTSKDEWERATPGEHTIGAGINVDDPRKRGLWAETTVRLLPAEDASGTGVSHGSPAHAGPR